MQMVVDPQGDVHAIYGEAIDLAPLGELAIRRASQVEPDEQARWWADLAPVRGPHLGPFVRRSDALQAEVAWLEKHGLANLSNPRRPTDVKTQHPLEEPGLQQR
jgi:hypothetical protein